MMHMTWGTDVHAARAKPFDADNVVPDDSVNDWVADFAYDNDADDYERINAHTWRITVPGDVLVVIVATPHN